MPVSDPDRDVSPYDVAEGVSGRSVDPLWMRFARKLGVDRAIGFAVAGRLWQVVSGPITQAFLLLYFTDQQRGFYYAFLYLIALQAFVELGFQVVLINLSSHEWSKLTFLDGRLDGDSTAICRLGSLWQKSRTWYLFASLVFTLAVSVFGYEFLGAKESGTPQVNWTVPWMVFVIVHGLHLTLVPAIGILEGCGQIAHLNKYRVWQGVLGSVVVWLLMWQGFGLWSLVGAASVRLLGDGFIAIVLYRGFFAPLGQVDGNGGISWKEEVLPLQWRIGLQGPLTWLARSMPGLVIFHYHNSSAGRWGMTWHILSTLQMVCASWIDSSRPEFGRRLADHDVDGANQLFRKLCRISLLVLGLLLFAVVCCVVLLGQLDWSFARKVVEGLLPWEEISLLAVAMLLMHMCHCMNIFGLAHKRDYFFRFAVASNLTTSVVVFGCGWKWGATGVVVAVLAVTALVQVPAYLYRWSDRDKWARDL